MIIIDSDTPYEKVLTIPKGKAGVLIYRRLYEQMAKVLLEILIREEELTLNTLISKVDHQLRNHFQGNIAWHLVHVKQDLESQGFLQTFFIIRSYPVVRINKKNIRKSFWNYLLV